MKPDSRARALKKIIGRRLNGINGVVAVLELLLPPGVFALSVA